MSADRIEPILPARDLDEIQPFYRRLGFTSWFEEQEWPGYAIMSRGDLVLHFFAAPELEVADNDTGCYWRLTDANRFHEECASLGLPTEGIPRLTEPCDTPWGMREFALVDPSGNLMRIGQEIA